MLRIATRASALALWQAQHVADALRAADPTLVVELVRIETTADRRLDVPIAAMGGKGVFVKEVQAALLDGRADIAVHSAKDLPARTPDGLVIAAVPERADPRDVLVGSALAALPRGARVATGSNRRRVQLAQRRPDLSFPDLRGNIATRLAKAGDFDAIVMAKAALDRLEPELRASGAWPTRIEVLEPGDMVPQVGQGALAVECRADDHERRERLAGLDHAPTRRAVDTERAFLAELGGDCTLPAGAHATLDGSAIRLAGVLGAPDRPVLVKESRLGREPELLGRLVARNLLEALGSP